MPPPAEPQDAPRAARDVPARAIARSRASCCRPARRGGDCWRRSTRRRASTAISAAPSPCWAHLAPRASDMLVSRGERMSAALLAAVLTSAARTARSYVDARRDRRHRRTARRRGAEHLRRPTPRARERCGRSSPAGATAGRSRASSATAPTAAPTTLGRGGSDLTATLLAPRARRAHGRAVEGRPRHPHRRSAARARRAAHPAAPPSRGGRGRPLRREGAPPARAHPDRGHAHRAARAVVPRSRSARHRSLGAALAGRPTRSRRSRSCAGQAIVTVAGKGMVGVHGIAARTFGAIEAEQLSVSTIFQASSESSIGFTLAEAEADRAVREPAAGVPRRAVERADRQRHRAPGHGGHRGRRRRHGRHARASPRACSRRSRPAASTSSRSRRDRPSATSRSRSTARAGRRGGAPRPRGVPAVEDRRRPAAERRRGPTSCSSASAASAARWPIRLPRRPNGQPAVRVVGLLDRSGYVFEPRGLSRRAAAASWRARRTRARCSTALGGRAGDGRRSADDHGRARGVAAGRRRRDERRDRRPAPRRARPRLRRRARQQEAAGRVVEQLRAAARQRAARRPGG